MKSRLRALAALIYVVVAGCATAATAGSHYTPTGGTSPTSSATAGLVYGLDATSDLVAYNATTGAPEWVTKLSDDTGSGQLLVSGDTIFLLDNDLTAFRATDGKQLWQVGVHNGQMFWGNDTLYVLAAPGSPQELYAVNPQSGRLWWQVQLTLASSPSQHDNAETGIYQDGVIYLATDAGAAALEASSGQQIWSTSASIGSVFKRIVWTPDALLVQTNDASLPPEVTDVPCHCLVSAFDPTSGKLLWDSSNLGNPGLDPLYSVISPTLGLYQFTVQALTSFNLATGKPLWSIPFSQIAFGGLITHWQITPTAIIFVNGMPNSGDLVALDARTGTQLWTDQSGDAYATSALGSSAFYVLGSYGVQAYSLATGQELWYQNQPASDPQLQTSVRLSTLGNVVLVTHPLSKAGGPPVYTSLDGRTGKQLWTSQTNGVVSLYIAADVTSPALTLSPPPPAPTPTAVPIAGCATPSSQIYFVNPPGPLRTPIPLPPGTLIEPYSMGFTGDGAQYTFCTPGATPAAISAYMDSALPAAGWTASSPRGCTLNLPPGMWYKAHYAIQVVVGGSPPADSSMWEIETIHFC